MSKEQSPSNLYEKAASKSLRDFKTSLLEDINQESFDWDLLIEMLIIEDTPLQSLFSIKSVYLGKIYQKNAESVSLLDEMNNGFGGEEEQESQTEESKTNLDDFNDF